MPNVLSDIIVVPCPKCKEETIKIFSREGGLNVSNLGGKRKLTTYKPYYSLMSESCSKCGAKRSFLVRELKGEGYL